jgi:hypothetical protein
LLAEPTEGQGVPGDSQELVVPFLAPILECVFVQQVDVFRDLRLAEHLFVLLAADANHARHQGGCGGQVVGGQRQALGVEVIDGQVAVRVNDDRPGARLTVAV